MGIEPTPSAWKAEVLPLNYTRLASRFRLLVPRSQPGRTGGGGRIRTYEGMSRQIYSLLPLAAWVPLPDREPRILGGFRWRPVGGLQRVPRGPGGLSYPSLAAPSVHN
jgi:hypothetical protein